MVLGSQRDYAKRWPLLKKKRWSLVVLSLVKRRRENSSVHFLSALQKYDEHKREHDKKIGHVQNNSL